MMKQVTTILAILLGFTMNAQWLYGSSGVGVQQSSCNASGVASTAMGNSTTASGTFSTAMGNGPIASGYASTAMGVGTTTASGTSSTAMGGYTTASGWASTAMGYSTIASGDYSTAMGQSTIASGSESTAMGAYTTASGYSSTAMGDNTTASGNSSTAMGYATTASGYSSTAMGNGTTASGTSSTAMGDNTKATDYASLTVGRYNSVNRIMTSGGDSTAFDTDNAAFVIGNGTASNAVSDAFVVRFNGNATLSGNLTINSDERLKDNIQPLGSTLNKLHQIEAKTYSLKKDEEHTPKIGVLAQEVQAVFPELVTEGADGILSVNYQGLVPVLINAINEQQLKMSEQDAKIAALEAQNAEIKELKEMVRVLALQQSQTTSFLQAGL